MSTSPEYGARVHLVLSGIALLGVAGCDVSAEEHFHELSDRVQVDCGRLETCELTRAVRSVSIDGLDVRQGQIIGLLNGNLTVAGDNLERVTLELLRTIDAGKYEIATIYFGQDVTQADAEGLAAHIGATFSNLQTEIIYGGQPYMYYILSVE